METSKSHKRNTGTSKPAPKPPCTKPLCFFCAMEEPQPFLRRAKLSKFFKKMPLTHSQDHILALNRLWRIAMTRPDDPELPSLGIFRCMAKLIRKAVDNREWLFRDQNVYIPYYAAHIIGSYTMNRRRLARRAVKAGVISPLLELLKGELSWVEQRVAVRALGHLASHEATFQAVAVHEVETVESAMEIACNCVDVVYQEFVSIRHKKRVGYHRDLLTRGIGGSELEDRKAEEWASQLRCWSLYLLDCFARKERGIGLICKPKFLNQLCRMCGRFMNRNSPAEIGLIKTLCRTRKGRETIADLKEVIETLCNISRSSDDCQFTAIESLLLLLKDPETRYKVLNVSAQFLVDLLEIQRNRLGERITQTILQDYHKIRYGNLKLKSKEAEEAIKETWDLKVERRKRENLSSAEEMEEREVAARRLKRQGNDAFRIGEIEEAVEIYSKGLDLCPLKMREERVVLHSNRAQCFLLLKKPASAVRDATRALCLAGAASPHKRSLWRRSQAYDMAGLAKESLMDCLMFVGRRVKQGNRKRVAIPYYAARMISKQMSATSLFASTALKKKRVRDLHLHLHDWAEHDKVNSFEENISLN